MVHSWSIHPKTFEACPWIGLDWNALFYVDKIVKKRKSTHKMHNAIQKELTNCLIKVNIKNNNNMQDKIHK